jgi:anti-anti-sigma factor
MTIKKREINVYRLPQEVTARSQASFLLHLRLYGESERPRVVLDCSEVRKMDSNMIHLILRCLEEVMKCNGDARLAGMSPRVEMALQQAGINRLFEIYDTAESAVISFHGRPNSLAPVARQTNMSVGLRAEEAA